MARSHTRPSVEAEAARRACCPQEVSDRSAVAAASPAPTNASDCSVEAAATVTDDDAAPP
eukprot:CAMPEP_0179850576 /NCGR_PEP_ID=MMETSP0982-20121206/7777_1 /TAXON_ID=483367 /ORGANISM="non described non described, Strain CCMP 2436" /LENGTH=59 /DNA_ID=CAMNT_0021736011 /DNA_START=165 /DNA_END=340 /DNA_ORIENTATION=-